MSLSIQSTCVCIVLLNALITNAQIAPATAPATRNAVGPLEEREANAIKLTEHNWRSVLQRLECVFTDERVATVWNERLSKINNDATKTDNEQSPLRSQ